MSTYLKYSRPYKRVLLSQCTIPAQTGLASIHCIVRIERQIIARCFIYRDRQEGQLHTATFIRKTVLMHKYCPGSNDHLLKIHFSITSGITKRRQQTTK